MLSRAYVKTLAFSFFPHKIILMTAFEHEFETLHLVLDLKNIRGKKEFKNIREGGWINCRKCIIDLTSCSMCRDFSSTCKWYLLFVNDNFVKKWVLKIKSWIYILLWNNHLGNIFAKVITTETLFALTKLSVIADCQGEFWGLSS